jgi:hypothetical protein
MNKTLVSAKNLGAANKPPKVEKLPKKEPSVQDESSSEQSMQIEAKSEEEGP